MMKSLAGITGVLLIVSASGLAAQQHRHGQDTAQARMGQLGGMGQMGMMGDGMALPAFQPARLLEQRETLALTDEQVARLEAIQAAAKEAQDQAMATHEQHHEQMMQVLQGERPDPETIQTHFMAAHAAMGMAHWAAMDAGLKAKAVLTDAQRAKVDTAMPGGGMQHRHGQGGQRMR
jgi:hypothetical protein